VHGDALTHRERKALAALLDNPTVIEAAAAAGLDRRTIFRYLRKPRFTEALRAASGRLEAVSEAAIKSARGVALRRLLRLVEDDSVSPAVQVRACATILDHSHKTALADLERRVTDLETRRSSGQSDHLVDSH